jgi:hypothetical protein
MNNPVSPHLVACLILGCVSPLAAQNSGSSRNIQEKRERISESATPHVSLERPGHREVRGEVSGKPPIYTAKDFPSRETKNRTARSIHKADGFDVLGEPTPQRRMVSASRGQQHYEVAANSLQNGLSLVASLYRDLGKTK